MEKNINNIFVSIIIPVYNVEIYLHECLNSIISQNFESYEIILINDGSIDKSGEICNWFVEKYPQVQVIHKKNEGTASARNTGIKLAKGDFLWFVDSDDFVVKDSLSILYKTLENKEAEVCNFNKIQFADNKPDKENLSLNSNLGNSFTILDSINVNIPTSVCYSIFKRKFLLENGIVFNESNQFEDELFNLELYLNFQFKVLNLDLPLYIYRRHRENSKTNSRNSEEIFQRCISILHLFEYMSKVKKDFISEEAINLKKRGYAEVGLFLLGVYLKNKKSLKKRLLLKSFKKVIKRIPIKGKWLKSTQIPRILYNMNSRFFVLYINFIYKNKIVFDD